ncbi:hypothetical protein [Sediminispirochaeta bajacaliforniensis]|uniref:hypothetical protein n=1 Tax=Sediminispirochaeta bajacaliforniensis TaxID=148 RepID=UPI00037BA325|nr:hypothetical protein [Sediminispirochaeta bajacaliforniensis]
MEKLNSQERIIEIVKLLAKRHYSGMTNKQLAFEINTSETNICRDMAILEGKQWIIRGSANEWRLSPQFGGIANEIMKAYQTARLRLTEEEARYASAMQ